MQRKSILAVPLALVAGIIFAGASIISDSTPAHAAIPTPPNHESPTTMRPTAPNPLCVIVVTQRVIETLIPAEDPSEPDIITRHVYPVIEAICEAPVAVANALVEAAVPASELAIAQADSERELSRDVVEAVVDFFTSEDSDAPSGCDSEGYVSPRMNC